MDQKRNSVIFIHLSKLRKSIFGFGLVGVGVGIGIGIGIGY
jgi:hypothetical protein